MQSTDNQQQKKMKVAGFMFIMAMIALGSVNNWVWAGDEVLEAEGIRGSVRIDKDDRFRGFGRFRSGELIGEHVRRFERDDLTRFHPAFRRFDPRYFRRLPIGITRRFFGRRVSREFEDVDEPCGGARFRRGEFRRLALGRRAQFAFRIDEADADAVCRLALMCPGGGLERTLWRGSCARADLYRQDVDIPADVGPCSEGECFVQWRLDRPRARESYSNCLDVVLA